MLKTLRIILSVIGMALAGYSLITKNFEFMSYMMFFVGVLMLVTGVAELQANGNQMRYLLSLQQHFYFLSPFILFKLTKQVCWRRKLTITIHYIKDIVQGGKGRMLTVQHKWTDY